MQLRGHKRNWDDLGTLDAYWAVLTRPDARYGQWDAEEFFQTAGPEVTRVMAAADRLGVAKPRDAMLDFGCGVGRLTRAFSPHFQRCYGVDVSASMVAKAKELNQAYPNCAFIENPHTDLRLFADATFDLIYSVIVLQHVPDTAAIRAYITEFVRALKPGGLLIFQLPSYIAPKDRRQMRSRLYSALRTVGFSPRFVYTRLRLHPIRMSFLPEDEVVALLQGSGARVLDVQPDELALPALSRTYWVTK